MPRRRRNLALSSLVLITSTWLFASSSFADDGGSSEEVNRNIHAYEESKTAALAFEIASSYEKLHQPEQARVYYVKCVATPDVDPELAAKAQARISAIDVQAVTSASIEGLPSAPPTHAASPSSHAMMMSTVEPPWSPLKTWSLAIGGLGVAAVAIGATFLVLSSEKTTEADQYCTGNVCSSDQVPDLRNGARSDGHVAAVMLVVGAALVASGVVLWLVAPNPTSTVTSAKIGATPLSLHAVW